MVGLGGGPGPRAVMSHTCLIGYTELREGQGSWAATPLPDDLWRGLGVRSQALPPLGGSSPFLLKLSVSGIKWSHSQSFLPCTITVRLQRAQGLLQVQATGEEAQGRSGLGRCPQPLTSPARERAPMHPKTRGPKQTPFEQCSLPPEPEPRTELAHRQGGIFCPVYTGLVPPHCWVHASRSRECRSGGEPSQVWGQVYRQANWTQELQGSGDR